MNDYKYLKQAYDVASKLREFDKDDDIESFGPKIIELMKGLPVGVFILLDEKPGQFSYMNDRFYMLRQVRNNAKWGRIMFDNFRKE